MTRMRANERTAPTLRDQINHEQALELWHAGRDCTRSIAARLGLSEEEVCAIIERAERRRV
ncbi:hypothetical protein MRS76_20490 [Rhizobiaceae bacterium n13]|uniref:hypothetical protein n=1 Tax=Ferirhizobium litorale TaxID=2927786 RepID=UPI0024B2EDB8|nr:hypothetical protein [Fererhizobium litorale]MDI7864321.1 hypothetical protein [Fererhizobium litorale]